MTIEFLCSHCSAHIRVPDRAGGRGGECPRCRKKIKVPKKSTLPETPASAPTSPAVASTTASSAKPGTASVKGVPAAPGKPATPVPASATSAKSKVQPVATGEELEIEFASLDETTGEEIPAGAITPPTDGFLANGGSPSTTARPSSKAPAKTIKVRRRNSNSGLLVGLIAIVLVAALGGAGYWWTTQSSVLKEPVQAFAETPAANLKVTIRGTAINASEESRNKVLRALERTPLPILSAVMEIYIASSDGNLDISVNRGKQTQFVAIEIPSTSPIRELFQKNFDTLAQPQTELLATSPGNFIEAYARQLSGKGTAGEIPRFRDSLALAQLVGPLGFHLVAKTGDGNSYRCVAEDGPLLWFLLPPGVKSFTVEGRPIGNTVMLPVQLLATVTSDPLPTTGPAQPVAEEPTKDKANGEMLPEGGKPAMDPETKDADGMMKEGMTKDGMPKDT
jgi:DNA-directed RNA polymerase subunit RPC12/RpoP